MHLDPIQLATLSAILRNGSFEGAAAELHVTPPAVSQRIRALEDRLGAPVVTRTTPVAATSLGARLARHADHVALLESDLARDLGHFDAGARLRIAVNADSLDTWFLPALVGINLEFELVIDDQAHSVEWLRRGEVSAALTDTARTAQGCDAHALGALEYVATASPEFVERWMPDGLEAGLMRHAPMLQFTRKDRLQHDWLCDQLGEKVSPPTLMVSSTNAFVEACRLGLAWGLNPTEKVAGSLADGSLKRIHPAPCHTPLFWQVSRLVSQPLKPLTDAVRRAAKAALIAP